MYKCIFSPQFSISIYSVYSKGSGGLGSFSSVVVSSAVAEMYGIRSSLYNTDYTICLYIIILIIIWYINIYIDTDYMARFNTVSNWLYLWCDYQHIP